MAWTRSGSRRGPGTARATWRTPRGWPSRGRWTTSTRRPRSCPAGDLVGALRRIPGVGPTTAVFLAFLRGRFDAGTLVDSATRAAAAERWFGGARADDAEIRAVAAPAGPWAGLALHWATMRRWQRMSDLA